MVLYGIFGGTFDPVHTGHVALIQGIQKEIEFTKITIVPSQIPPPPPIRQPPQALQHRIHMLNLAFQCAPYCVIDAREKRREGPSYTVKVLESFRQSLGEKVPLCFILGMDAFRNLSTWFQHEKLLELAHLVVVNRKVSGAPLPLPNIASSPNRLKQKPAGLAYFAHFTPPALSATEVRMRLKNKKSCKSLIPQPVWEYIRKEGLYRD